MKQKKKYEAPVLHFYSEGTQEYIKWARILQKNDSAEYTRVREVLDIRIRKER